MNFADLGLSPEVLKAVADAGYTQPTPIQEKAIPYVLMGRDVLGCAQTGTGKTASFTLPMIDILAGGRARARMPRSLILEPTRELAQQVSESFEKYGKHNRLSMALLIGGTSMGDQEKVLDRGVDVLIATPGRLLDLFERGKILMADVKTLVIDEADRMLDMGFIPDVEKIVSKLSPMRQTLFFSATMPPEIRRLADKFLSNPKEVSVDPPSRAAETVTQALLRTPSDPKAKREALRALLEQEKDELNTALIFCNRKAEVALLQRSLARHGFDAKALHGDMSQPARTETLEQFRDGKIRILVCSDVAARGLDIPAVSHVFNFDVPVHAEDYIHRIGRTGRAGRSGKAFMLVTPADSKLFAALTRLVGRTIPEIGHPNGAAPLPETTEEAAPRGRREPREARAPRERRQRRAAAVEPVADVLEPDAPTEEEAPIALEPRPERAERRERGTRGRDRARDEAPTRSGERQPSSQPHNPTNSFGDHTPAFLLRPVRAAG